MNRRTVAATLLALAAAAVASGCGSAHNHSSTGSSDPSTTASGSEPAAAPTTGAAPRTVNVTMSEYAYSPATITVSKGETVSFRFENNGVVLHEAFIGSEAEQEEHDAMMASGSDSTDHSMDGMSGMEGMDHSGHSMGDEAMVRVEAGEAGTLVHTFDKAGTFIIGCHQPGHWVAGMRATVVVQ